MIHTVKGFGIVNKAEIDVFLELSCFFHDPADNGNLISGSSAFSKTTLNSKQGTLAAISERPKPKHRKITQHSQLTSGHPQNNNNKMLRIHPLVSVCKKYYTDRGFLTEKICSQPESRELFHSMRIFRTSSQGGSISSSPEKLLWEVRDGVRLYRSLQQREKIVWTSKITGS